MAKRNKLPCTFKLLFYWRKMGHVIQIHPSSDEKTTVCCEHYSSNYSSVCSLQLKFLTLRLEGRTLSYHIFNKSSNALIERYLQEYFYFVKTCCIRCSPKHFILRKRRHYVPLRAV
ncbi:uncharacterized protein [Anabrus simplex]|uniref:uncharacterized protein n=1 Tax=Anabrus simplex TaxID=316456 RepID=UPI0035A34FA4